LRRQAQIGKDLAANFANQHELTQEKERETDLRAERLAPGARDYIAEEAL
jgi:hypothetical protein